ncbi:hypothetical protein AVEN_97350-1 [Araneus ventricosus]|uniref:Uncharacterized protein n=1 Tax=Araneus ventricosus TaxID=182803 RepID=A0A4Y2NVT5_ARAVE|nr:hypothetical protein AVEN_97350-1 [Araneus ventricosus]
MTNTIITTEVQYRSQSFKVLKVSVQSTCRLKCYTLDMMSSMQLCCCTIVNFHYTKTAFHTLPGASFSFAEFTDMSPYSRTPPGLLFRSDVLLKKWLSFIYLTPSGGHSEFTDEELPYK